LINPTVGRVVWFWPNPDLCPGPWPGEQPLAAIIAHVHHPRLVNLTVFEMSGRPIGYEFVALLQEGDEKPVDQRGFASWMPYQLGQAKRHEADGLSATNGGGNVPVQQPSLTDTGSTTDEGQQAGQGQAVEGQTEQQRQQG